MTESYLIFICLLGLVVSDNSTIGDHSVIEDVSEISNVGNNLDGDDADQGIAWGEWSPWSKWSGCTRTCGGGISRQQRRCRRKPCKGRAWSAKYKICNAKPCEQPNDFRAEQCAAFDDVPYSGQLLKWYPHYDPARPCSLICRGEQAPESGVVVDRPRQGSADKTIPHEAMEAFQYDSDETIVVQLADKVEDGTRCYASHEILDVCIGGECMKVGCDLRVGSNKNIDSCGVCGGNGSSCQSKYTWSLESISACSRSCGGGFKIAVAVCKAVGLEENTVDDSYCDPDGRPEKTLMPCNTHPCMTKWVTGEWSKCSASCGGGSRTRAVFCTEENGNETTKLPEHKCSGMHKPRYQETCNTISCPMWETNQWSECSVTCGIGIRTRAIECRDGIGKVSSDCDPAERPHTEQECRTNIVCSIYGDEFTQPLMQPYPPPPVPEKLMDQPIPSESTFVAEEWSPCSVTCGEGIRRREVHCKIYLEFSRTIAKLPDRQCSGPKPIETEKCVMEPCGLMENSLSYRIDTVGDSGYAEPSLTDSYRSPSGSSSGSGYDGGIKVAPGSDVQTTYSWKEAGYTPCTATCLGGVQDLMINCVRDDTGKTVMPLLCTAETKPEARIRTCNDHPCPPRWNYSDFSQCMSPCGIGIQTRDVTCIHEVTRGTGNTVAVPNHMCPQPPPADRRYCNVWDCPIKWSTENWGKCSKTCGGGVKKRKVVCEQIMAQGRKQSREDRECPANKPPTERPCNTRACHKISVNAQPTILSQNTTYNQSDLNTKVDLKIGGIAKIFHGTPFIKIRCPVKKFDKSQVTWMKDHQEIQKSRKYKISRKGALKVVDIDANDAGIYACVAGHSHAETRIIVKFRSKEQISSEEYLRLGNSVHLERIVNLDSAPANSGESLYTDRAAAYGNRFVPIDSEDLSHERAVPSKPTRKPHQKKQKTSPSPPDATMVHKEHTVTSLNQKQPGYHESVELPASSSASRLMPQLTYFISSIKAYWPFQGEGDSKRGHRTASVSFIEDGGKVSAATKHTSLDKQAGFRYQNMDDSLENFYRNTAIPDETFGPDEERIFIDVDPFDLDDPIFGLQHTEIVNLTQHILEKEGAIHSTKPPMDYIEESLRNVKRTWHDPGDSLRNQRGANKDDLKGTEETGTSGSMDIENSGFYSFVQDSSTKDVSRNSGSQFTLGNDDHSPFEVEDSSNSYSTVTSPLENMTRTLSKNKEEVDPVNKTDDYVVELEEEFRKRGIGLHVENSTMDDVSQGITTKSLDEKTEESANETASSKAISGEQRLEREKPSSTLTSTVSASDASNDSAIGSASILDTEELIFEWVTTEWSKCSQTCGGSGFQMRGAQCTVRPAKQSNATRVVSRSVIGANLCEDAGFPVPQKVRPCGSGKCPQWHTTEWTLCESSRCFNWKTAMQRRDVSCQLLEDMEDGSVNVTMLDPSKCDDATRPLQRQECYNDACKGVWRVGEWSECTASCEEDGIKYRILQCVWFGTKKPAGNACRDIPRPPVMKTCRGVPCPQSPEECKDQSQLCGRVKLMNMCRVPLYQKQCCDSCR